MENVLQRDKLVWLMLGLLLMGWMVYKGTGYRLQGSEYEIGVVGSRVKPFDFAQGEGQEEIIFSATRPITVHQTAANTVQVPVKVAAAVKPIAPPVVAVQLPKQESSQPILPIVAPVLMERVAPIYPATAIEKGISGEVQLLILVSATGSISEVKVANTSGDATLDLAAKNAAAAWKFNPARQGSLAVAAWYQVPIVFSLTN